MTTPEVYLIAFACEPDRGSEPGVGYAFARAGARLAREHDFHVVLVTRPHKVAAIRAALGAEAEHLEILAVSVPRFVITATGRPLVRYAYVLWQWRAVSAVARRLRRTDAPAVVHHVTFATEALPTFERRLAGRAALVFGPAGSTAVAGGGFRLRLRRTLRTVIARRNLSAADVLVAQNEHVLASWQHFRGDALVEANVVIEAHVGERPDVVWTAATAGRLIERKRVELAIAAFAGSGLPGRLAVIGDGPERSRLEGEAVRAGVAERVVFLGDLPRHDVIDTLARSRALLHPSRQEGSPWVVGEAQSVGTIPIVFAGSGADGPVASARMGVIVPDTAAMAEALVEVLAGERGEPSARWSADRLPAKLADWYGRAIAHAAPRTRWSPR